ncbi:MAG: hypothetical protein ACPHUD_11050, partial [Porticoccaceae bacterium]
GELTFDTTNKRVRIHDGATAGGFELKTENSSGDTLFADNEKAIFGAGSDLQIYHDSASGQSIIHENGPSVLKIRATDFRISNADNTADYLSANNGAEVSIRYNGAVKLATTSTGIDVTGTAVTDGVTVAGNLSVDGGTIKLDGNYPVGTGNVALGDAAMNGSISGNYNTAVGQFAGTSLTSGTKNVFLGSYTADANTTGNSNTALGQAALSENTTGSYNTAIGNDALIFNTTANNNTAVGYQAAYSTTIDG